MIICNNVINKGGRIMNLGAFGYVNVLKTAADASWLRQDVEFSTYLNSAIEQAASPASTLTQKVNNIDLDNITTRTYTDNATLSYRLDGNNVDLSTENAELASEQLNYTALIDSINNEFSRMKAVIK